MEAGSLCAGWNKVGQFSDEVGCGYFFDADNGIIGLGKFGAFGHHFVSTNPLTIYWTSDGGTTWVSAITPGGGAGRVTSIFMKNRLDGYASVYSDEYSLWVTTDGGKSWTDFTQGNYDLVTCVYATSKAIIRTTWEGKLGGSSTDGGSTYSSIFSGGIQESNGIDFSDDNTGVATLGPSQGNRATSWFTNDGGVTWNEGNDLRESWSVYAVKGTKIFFTCPEDDGSLNPPGHTVYWSQDGGNNWQPLYNNFPFMSSFTGHITGAGKTLYVQTNTSLVSQGLYRSDDLGVSWKNINGPSNTRDSRFAVAGCNGEVVYAFDNHGGVWKTTDGGDGTLHSPANTLSLEQDTLLLSGICASARGYIRLSNAGCTDYRIDSVLFSPDPYHEFSLDTTTSNLDLDINSNAGLPIVFQTDSSVTRITKLVLHGHFGNTQFDTTIIIIAAHAGINGPLLALADDSISISSICQPAKGEMVLTNRNCDSLFIDSMSFAPDLYGEFSVDSIQSGLNILSNASVGIPILFQCDSEVIRNTVIHIHAHSVNRIIDTTIIIRAEHATTPGPIMSLAFDSIYLETRYCQPIRRYIDFANLNCDSLVIDSITLDPQYPEFIIDSSQTPKLRLAKFSSGSVPVFFQTDSNLTRRTTMHIIAHSLDRKIDTTIILVAKHSTAPEPLLEIPAKAKPGEYTLIPMYLRQTQDSFTISQYSFHLSYDGDVLTPSMGSNNFYETHATLSGGASVREVHDQNGILCTVNLPSPITERSDLSQPLIYLRMSVTLSRNLYSDIRMDTFSISMTNPLPLCSIPQVRFLVDPLCGDSTISHFMLDSTMPEFLSVHPNPSSGGSIEALVFVPHQAPISLDIIDESGKCVQKVFEGRQYEKGKQVLNINTASLMSGKYELRMQMGESVISRSMVVQK